MTGSLIPDISFIVPVYGVERYLAKCLDSLVHQQVDKEIIIVHDGSPDGSLKIAEEYLARYPFITVINQHNRGLSAARNAGIRLARGRYLYFVDSDDYVVETAFTELVALADKYGVDALLGLLRYEYEDGSRPPHIRPPETPDLQPDQWALTDGYTHLNRMLSYDWAPGVYFGLYRSEFIRENRLYFPEGIKAEDAVWIVDCYTCRSDVRLMEVNRVFYHYLHRQGSITKTSDNTGFFKDAFQAARLLERRRQYYVQLAEQAERGQWDRFSDSPLSAERARQVAEDIQRIIVVIYSIAYRYQYLRYSDELKASVRHYFSPEVLALMKAYLSFEVIL